MRRMPETGFIGITMGKSILEIGYFRLRERLRGSRDGEGAQGPRGMFRRCGCAAGAQRRLGRRPVRREPSLRALGFSGGDGMRRLFGLGPSPGRLQGVRLCRARVGCLGKEGAWRVCPWGRPRGTTIM